VELFTHTKLSETSWFYDHIQTSNIPQNLVHQLIKKKIYSHYDAALPNEGISNQEALQKFKHIELSNLEYKRKMSDMIDLICGNNELLCSAIEKIKKNLCFNEAPLLSLKSLNDDVPKNLLFLKNWLRFINIVVLEDLDLIEPFCNKKLSDWINAESYHLLGKSDIPELSQAGDKRMFKAHEILVQKNKLEEVKLQQQA
jgi:hypothetical protein